MSDYDFSQNQLRKGGRRRCTNCVNGGGGGYGGGGYGSGGYGGGGYGGGGYGGGYGSSWSNDEAQLDRLAADYGWYKVEINQPETTSYKNYDNVRLNFYRKDGIAGQFTVGSYLDHPGQGKSQLFRRTVTLGEAAAIFANPRVHTGRGYHKTSEQQYRPDQQRTISCPLCGRPKKFKDIVGLAAHVESGSCSACLGVDNARNAVYQRVAQAAPGFVSNVPMIGYGDWGSVTAPESGAYICRACNRSFNTVSALMDHTKRKHPDSGYGQLQLGF